MKKIFILSSVLLLLSGMGCSYVMDSVEGAITKRSSFSVDVTRSGSSITFDWSKDAPSIDTEAFAGYEIYISDTANNEFAGYEVFAGSSYNPGWASSTEQNMLAQSTTQSVTITNPPSLSGTYFFRVGVIYWDEEKESDRVKNWGSSWKLSAGSWYLTNSKIDKISGGTMVIF